MTRRLLAAFLLLGGAPLAAQHPAVRASLGDALAQYREQDRILDFRGHGPTGRLDVTWRRFGLLAEVTRIDFTPTDTADAPVEGFRAVASFVAIRFRPLARVPAELELGVVKRTASPADNAQALRAWRVGGVAHFTLADGAELEPRAALLTGAKFSGGGSAGTALAFGLRAAYRPLTRFGWGWLVADYQFERYDRKTTVPVPLQGSTVSFGLEARAAP